MNDDQLQQEIERALAVEPSPQFVARVRQQLDTAGKRRRAWRWQPAAIGLVTVAVLMMIAGYAPQRTPEPLSHQAAAPAGAQPQVAVAEPAHPVVTTRKVKSDQTRKQPEVLIDPREAEAFHSFVEDVQERRIDPSKLQALFDAADRSRTLEVIEPMPVAGLEPIVIPPVAAAEAEKEGGNL